LGELFERSGRTGEAKAAYRRAAELQLATGRVEEHKRMLGRILSLDQNDTDAVTGSQAVEAVENGSATVEPMERDSPPLPGVVRGTGTSSERLPHDDGGGLPEETSWVLEETAQEGLVILEAAKEPVPGAPAALAIVDFYLKQGLEAEARAFLRRLVAAEPENTEASNRLASLESKALTEGARVALEAEAVRLGPIDGPKGSALVSPYVAESEHIGEPREEGADTSHAWPERGREHVDLMEEDHLTTSPPGVLASPRDQHPAAFDAVHSVDRSPETCGAHYRLGMAYRELGLLDEAIAEFRRSAADERLRLPACNMVGLCLLAKGDAEAAIHELNRGVSEGGRPAEEFYGIKYSLATAYQANGDLAMAASVFRDLEVESPSFRDVKEQARKLREGLDLGTDRSAVPEGRVDATRQTRSG
ncbi:MAG TPA: tetratricopeptide repeat protein, partial [Candidatus Methylomirabilis sp.]|nr:tetratricopeptide repeat protein [Candidatus Methylomirabilis sp.]